MYKLIIVDDDTIIRQGLSETIPWSEHGFEIAGTAEDGESGLELFEQVQPQIVISDICMPFMDGLELTKRIKASSQETRIILITSYEEFQFAQEALKLKVFDYVMKPADNEMVLDTVKRAASEIDLEKEIRKKVIDGLPLLKQRFLESLVRGRVRQEDMDQDIPFLGLPLREGYHVVILLKADEYSVSDYEARFGREMLKYCIQNVAEETLSKFGKGVVFDSYEDELVLVFGCEGDAFDLQRNAYLLSEEIRSNVENYLKTTVTAGIGLAQDKLVKIAISFKEAQNVLAFRHLYGKNKVLSAQDTEAGKIRKTWMEPVIADKELVMRVKLGMKEEAMDLLRRKEQEIIKSATIPLSQLRMLALELLLQLHREIPEWAEHKSGSGILTLFEYLEKEQTVRDIFARLGVIIDEIAAFVNHKRENQQDSIVYSAKRYLEEHFGEEKLSLQEVADAVHVSPPYLSTLFRDKLKINLSDYLLDIRMQSAMELLRLKHVKTYEAGYRVGYSNPQYFSVIFKKHTGMSPTEFKNKSYD